MSLHVCIPDLVASKRISEKNAEKAMNIYDELVSQYEPRFGRDAAESMATHETLKSMEVGNLNAKRQALLTEKKRAEILYNAKRVYDGGGDEGAVLQGKAMAAHLARDERAQGVQNVEYRWRNIKQKALAKLYSVLDHHRVGLLGEVRHKEDLGDFVRALHGEAVESVNAREMADAWNQTAEMLRQRFNAAGGNIGKLDDWGLPQSHDGNLIGAVKADEWIGFIKPLLDRTRMIDDLTAKPFSDARLELALREVYESIVSDGWNSRNAGGVGKASMANRHSEHRFLLFKNADDWMAYQDRFGAGTAYDAMMGHVETMSREIASMEILGPNPNATIDWMKDSIIKDAMTRGTQKDRDAAQSSAQQLDRLWAEISGENRRIGNRKLALFGSTLRNWQSGTKLGSAVLSSVSDVATSALVRHYNGLPVMKALNAHMKQLNPADPATREFARRAGIIGDEFTGRMGAQGRMFVDEAFGGRLAEGRGWTHDKLQVAAEGSRRIADGVLKASGLNAWTIAGREAMGMEFFSHITGEAGKKFDALDPAFRGFLKRYGMGADAWDNIRAAEKMDYKGGQWITPDGVADQGLRDRLMEAILTEVEFAVPTGGIAQRAFINGRLPPGSLLGELVRTGFQFKMFPITVMAMHGQRAMAATRWQGKAGYAAAFLGATTMTGALAFQMAELAKGRDPRPMGTKNFLGNAMLKGGGLGVWGDLIRLGQNEYGQKPSDILAGPSWGTAQSVTDLGRAIYTGKGEGKAVANLLKREVPASSLFYVRLAYERLLVDTVASWVDPDYGKSVERMEKRAAEQGSGFFIPPGAGLNPDAWRAPDFANALSAPPPEPEPES